MFTRRKGDVASSRSLCRALPARPSVPCGEKEDIRTSQGGPSRDAQRPEILHRLKGFIGMKRVISSTVSPTHVRQHAIPLNTPTEFHISDGETVTITLIDANHCPGSVMFVPVTLALRFFDSPCTGSWLKAPVGPSFTRATSGLSHGFSLPSSAIIFFSRIWPTLRVTSGFLSPVGRVHMRKQQVL